MQNGLSIREFLEARLKEATLTNGWRDSIAVKTSADITETTQQAQEREIATHDLDRRAALARDLRAAIGRLADGSYGICLECEQPISEKRLDAVPWAAFCIACQQKAERVKAVNGDAELIEP